MTSKAKWILMLIVFTQAVQGSIITFDKSPGDIKPYCTTLLTLRCSLADSPVSKSLTNIQGDIKFLTSLVVTRGGLTVATVSNFFPARAFIDIEKVTVNGTLSSNGPEEGYIEMAWAYPTRDQNGSYTCEAHGLDDIGRDVIFTADTDVIIEEHPIDQLIDDLNDEIIRVKEANQTCQYQLQTYVDQNNIAFDLNNVQQSTIANMTAQTMKDQATIIGLESYIAELSGNATFLVSQLSTWNIPAADWITATNGTYCPPNTTLTDSEMTAIVTEGSRVVRAEGWNQDYNSDGTPPRPGTVNHVVGGRVIVTWDVGAVGGYDMGAQGDNHVRFICMA